MSEIAIEGDVVPWSWYGALRFPSGKPDLNAIILLANIVYWYRATPEHDEHTGRVLRWKKRFRADLLQRSYLSYAEQFGLTKRQVTDALTRLQGSYHLLTLVFRTVDTAQGRVANVLFIQPLPEAIKAITHQRDRSHVSTGYLPHSNGTPPTLKRETSRARQNSESGVSDPGIISEISSQRGNSPTPLPLAALASPMLEDTDFPALEMQTTESDEQALDNLATQGSNPFYHLDDSSRATFEQLEAQGHQFHATPDGLRIPATSEQADPLHGSPAWMTLQGYCEHPQKQPSGEGKTYTPTLYESVQQICRHCGYLRAQHTGEEGFCQGTYDSPGFCVQTPEVERLIAEDKAERKSRRKMAGWDADPLPGTPEYLVALYNAHTPASHPKVKMLSPSRRAKAKTYLKMFPDLDWWHTVFQAVANSPFLRGEKVSDGHAGFRADFDWLLSKGKDGTENCVKVADGRYDEPAPPRPHVAGWAADGTFKLVL